MLACENLTVRLGPGKTTILNDTSARFDANLMHAVIGPSGCGKTTLMKAILRILPSEGRVLLRGEEMGVAPDWRGEVGFAPQFSIAHPHLTVGESLEAALELFVADKAVRDGRYEEILKRTGLAAHVDKRVDSLSGGQLRRLGLGLELTGDPACLICDEVTSGLDPRSEDHILAVLRGLQEQRGKTFICIIHNLAKLELFDRVTVVHEGCVVFQGTPDGLNAHFKIGDPLHLYDVLNTKPLAEWLELWTAVKIEAENENPGGGTEPESESLPVPKPGALPSMGAQTATLLRRRFVLFLRDRGYLWLTLGITLGFPCLVVIFALGGLPEVRSLALQSERGFIESIQASMMIRVEAIETASLVTGLIMFQVILLTLMGSNNGAREIAGERVFYEKERFSGLRPEAYAISKLIFCCLLAGIQGVYMTVFVKLICGFPGPWLWQMGTLALACMAMTTICLGLSSVLNSAEKSSLLSVYLVGFQLPLSGIVLALPDAIVWLCRPFINAYWGWSGYFGSMIETRFFDAFRLQETGYLPPPSVAAAVLLIHLTVGAMMVFWGCHRKGWK